MQTQTNPKQKRWNNVLTEMNGMEMNKDTTFAHAFIFLPTV